MNWACLRQLPVPSLTCRHRDSSTERAESSHRRSSDCPRTDAKTATADDSTLSPPRPNISRLDQVAGLQLTVTAIRVVSTRGCLGISISSTPSTYRALIASTRADSGRLKRRKNIPAARSMCSKPSLLTSLRRWWAQIPASSHTAQVYGQISL